MKCEICYLRSAKPETIYGSIICQSCYLDIKAIKINTRCVRCKKNLACFEKTGLCNVCRKNKKNPIGTCSRCHDNGFIVDAERMYGHQKFCQPCYDLVSGKRKVKDCPRCTIKHSSKFDICEYCVTQYVNYSKGFLWFDSFYCEICARQGESISSNPTITFDNYHKDVILTCSYHLMKLRKWEQLAEAGKEPKKLRDLFRNWKDGFPISKEKERKYGKRDTNNTSFEVFRTLQGLRKRSC